MGTTYNGKAGNESRAAAVNITSTATSAGLIAVYAAAHGLLTGDRVSIVGHGVVATAVGKEANGTWTVTKVDADHFTLAGSTYVGNGGATGTVQYLGLMPRPTLPDDGADLRTALAINNPNEDAKDGQVYLAERTGAYRLVTHAFLGFPSTGNTTVAAGSGGSGAWGTYDTDFDTNVTAFMANGGYVNFEPGDIIEMEFTSGFATGGPGTCVIALGGETCEHGVATTHAFTSFGSVNAVNGMGETPMTVRGMKTMGGTRGARLYPLMAAYGIGGASSYTAAGGFTFSVKVWRSNA